MYKAIIGGEYTMNYLKTLTPLCRVALLSLLIGSLFFAYEYSNFLIIFFNTDYIYYLGYESRFELLIDYIIGAYGWLGHIGLGLFLFCLFYLYRKQGFIKDKKAIIISFVSLFTIGAAMSLLHEFYFIVSINRFNPFDIIAHLIINIFNPYGWGSHVSLLMLIIGVIILVKAYKPDASYLQQELPQEEESEMPQQSQNELSVMQWFWTMFLLGIPFVNLILLLVWGFGAPNPRKNFSLSILLYAVVMFVIAILMFFVVLLAGV